jgi:hypothetical protein
MSGLAVMNLNYRRMLTLALLVASAWPVQAQLPGAAESTLKAQVLVKVLRFVEWPAGALSDGQPLHLCLAEDTPLAQELRSQDGQSVGRNPLQVRVVRNRQFAGCQIALVGDAQAPLPIQHALLWVTEAPGMLERGGMLNLQVEDGRVVFDVGLDAVRRAGLDISAKLLRLARFVKKA